MSAQFLIGVFVLTEAIAGSLHNVLARKSFAVRWSQSSADFNDWVVSNRHRIDCLIVESSQTALTALKTLKQQDILLPALTVGSEVPSIVSYHEAITCLDLDDPEGVDAAIHQAVDLYLKLPTSPRSKPAESANDKRLFLLSLQQQRLTEKLKERLGYAGVYYKRNPQNFLRNMSSSERNEFLDKLRQDYRHIILNYFANDSSINQKIDDFVNVAFFADMSVPKIVEIHMELIDDFSKQLQLEGRNDDILSDYRLTLIDVIAHLCEMYRRALPRDL